LSEALSVEPSPSITQGDNLAQSYRPAKEGWRGCAYEGPRARCLDEGGASISGAAASVDRVPPHAEIFSVLRLPARWLAPQARPGRVACSSRRAQPAQAAPRVCPAKGGRRSDGRKAGERALTCRRRGRLRPPRSI
jgi:hypothetical protein